MADEVHSPVAIDSTPTQAQEPPSSKKRGPDDHPQDDAVSPKTPGRDSKRRKGSQSQRSQNGDSVIAATPSQPGTRPSSRRASIVSGVATTVTGSGDSGPDDDDEDDDEESNEGQRAEGTGPGDVADAEPRVFARNGLQFKVPRYVQCQEEPQGGIAWIRQFVELNVGLAPGLTTTLMADALGEHCDAVKMTRKKRKTALREFVQAIKTVPLDELEPGNAQRKIKTSYWRRTKSSPSTPGASADIPSQKPIDQSPKNAIDQSIASADVLKGTCTLCNASDHYRDDCEKLWRSFDPSKGPIRKVSHILAYCSLCGAEGHYFADCSLKPAGFSATSTWSLANRALYIDPDCSAEPIEKGTALRSRATARGFHPPPRRGTGGSNSNHRNFNHRSMAANSPATHVRFSESDSEGEFLSQPVRRHTSNGGDGIRIATNLSLPPRPVGGVPPPPSLASRVTGEQALPERSVARADTWGGGRSRGGRGGYRGRHRGRR